MSKKKSGDYQIPFDQQGNQLSYANRHWGNQHVVWVDNYEFDDVLTFTGHGRGQSAAKINFERISGATVSMFLSDFDSVMPHAVRGKVEGRFTFVKRGENFGVKLIRAANTDED